MRKHPDVSAFRILHSVLDLEGNQQICGQLPSLPSGATVRTAMTGVGQVCPDVRSKRQVVRIAVGEYRAAGQTGLEAAAGVVHTVTAHVRGGFAGAVWPCLCKASCLLYLTSTILDTSHQARSLVRAASPSLRPLQPP